MMKWETVIGLEVHAELSTETKIFCGCKAGFGGEANTQVCPICAGMPGTLPKLNRTVVEYAIRAGMALNCKIQQSFKFDRKNYFYPDLPKAYQISQLFSPICQNGQLEIELEEGKKTIGIREIHMEEDAGKLIHDHQSGSTFMDFNRCGVPLLEIVTQPDFRNSREVTAYLEKLREILMYLDICDCKMQEGSLRIDVNISVRPEGGELGVRTEMKNLNSLKAISRAIEYESVRHIKILESGGQITQETRRWDDIEGISYEMRTKENAQDYRYFPEPDLLPIHIDEEWMKRIRSSIPELAHEKRERYMRDFKLATSEAVVITGHKRISDLFEALVNLSAAATESAHLIVGEIMRLMSQTDTLPESLSVNEKKLAILIDMVVSGRINRNAYKEAIEAVFLEDADPEKYIIENGLMMLTDDSVITQAAAEVVSDNPDAAKDYRLGKEKAFGYLVGQTMKKLGGAGNPEAVRKALENFLHKEH